MSRSLVLPFLVLFALLVPSAAVAHPERPTQFPDPAKGFVPKLRTGGPSLVVCKSDSAKRIRGEFRGRRLRNRRLALVSRCRFRHIQAAVNKARNRTRILVLPGVYREEPSRRKMHDQVRGCPAGGIRDPGDGHGKYATYEYQLKCPNSRNTIAILGDTNGDRLCDHRCSLQIQGMGARPKDVTIIGDRVKEDVIRADRADGFAITNVLVQEGAFNDIDVVESNGFRLQRLVTRWAQNYGVLSFTSDNGLYDSIEAYGNGDSGVYPGSGPERHCKSYGIEIRKVNSYGNVLGMSGTAGNGTWVHDSHFHNNAAGISNDSFASGHPGMPQDCSKFEKNRINSNNNNFFSLANQKYCTDTPYDKVPRGHVCPQFQVPVGSGYIGYGVNDNIIRRNRIWDNWRSGVRLFWVPGAIRGDSAPSAQFDTSNGNMFVDNSFGRRPGNVRDPNGVDVFWDEEGARNCWSGNTGATGGAITSDPAVLPGCPGVNILKPSNPVKSGMEVPCANWDPATDPKPVGCTWFDTPPEPK